MSESSQTSSLFYMSDTLSLQDIPQPLQNIRQHDKRRLNNEDSLQYVKSVCRHKTQCA